nr:hypothetical protein [Streptomyces sp. SID685]
MTILGGGGFRVPLVYGALLTDRAPGRVTEVVLHDLDAGRLHAVSRVLAEQAAESPDAPRVSTTTDLDEALRGADFVFSAIRVGGLDGRAQDERVALAEGVLGQETVGAGGIAYGLRTVPVATDIARRVARLAPDAWVINFTNPAGLVTEAMSRHLGDRVIGICDSPVGLGRRVARVLGADPEDAFVDYVGLNHLGWVRGLRVAGRDELPRLLADPALLGSFEEGRLFGPDWLSALGAIPNEYLHYYYFNRETVRDSVLRVLESVRPLPAYVVSRYNRVLAANPPGRRLLPGLWDWPEHQRNVTRYLFLHPVGRTLYEPWEDTVALSVAHLRAVAGADPDNPELTTLVGELVLKSPEFARLWERYDVCERGGGQKKFRHPEVGPMTLTYEVMRLARTGGQRVVVYQAAPGTADEEAMLGLEDGEPARRAEGEPVLHRS